MALGSHRQSGCRALGDGRCLREPRGRTAEAELGRFDFDRHVATCSQYQIAVSGVVKVKEIKNYTLDVIAQKLRSRRGAKLEEGSVVVVESSRGWDLSTEEAVAEDNVVPRRNCDLAFSGGT